MVPAKVHRATDERLSAILIETLLSEGTITSQRRLADLVNARLRKHEMPVTPPRLRRLALQTGLVLVTIRTRHGGATPELKRCPVCHARLRTTINRNLLGDEAHAGYRCTRCPYWTGRELRVPHLYTFASRVTRGQDGEQLAFVMRDNR